MSDVAKSKELLKRYSIARIPFIAINTIERSRALEILKSISEELTLPFNVHTLSKGTYELLSEKSINDDKSVYGAIEYMSEQMKRKQNMTFILTEPPDISSDNADSRQLMDLVELANESGGVVMVLTNNTVWNQLQRKGMIIKIDLPHEEEMYSIIKKLIEDYRSQIPIEWENDFKDYIGRCTAPHLQQSVNGPSEEHKYRKMTKYGEGGKSQPVLPCDGTLIVIIALYHVLVLCHTCLLKTPACPGSACREWWIRPPAGYRPLWSR